MFRDQFEFVAHVARQTRNWEQAQADGDAARLRRQRVTVIEAGLRAAVQHTPDLFPALDVHVLAERVVDLIEGRG